MEVVLYSCVEIRHEPLFGFRSYIVVLNISQLIWTLTDMLITVNAEGLKGSSVNHHEVCSKITG